MTDPKLFGEKYLLLDTLGIGGMAEILRGKLLGEKGFEKLIVIKRLLPHLNKDEEMVNHFIDEARLAALLQHDNIACIYDFGNSDGSHFIAMEYLFGKDLHSFMQSLQKQKRAVPPEFALYITLKVCEAMEYAHSLKDLQNNPLNIIHRDLTPHNIFVTYEGKIKVLDFGIAKNELQENKTQVGMVKGKVSYMSPEQLAGVKIDHRSDIFSIGILLYEMLCGEKLYTGDAGVLIQKVIKAEYKPLSEIAPGLPSQLHSIVEKAIQPDLSRRYQSCSHFQADIEKCLSLFSERVSTKTLKKYILTLFEKEFEEESENATRVISKASLYSAETKNQTSPTVSGKELSADKTEVFSTIPDKKSKKVPLRFSLIPAAVSLVCITVVVTWLFLKTALEEDKPAQAPPEPDKAPQSESISTTVTAVELPENTNSSRSETWRRVQDLLMMAATAFSNGKLVEGSDSAYKYYNDVLILDEENRKAQKGLDKVAGRLHLRALQQIKELELKEARATLDDIALYFPGNSKTKEVQEKYRQAVPKKIQELSAAAELALDADRLTSPTEDCALKYYDEIKELNENSSLYKDGYRKIADRYAAQAEDAHRKLKLPTAKVYVARGLSVVPDHEHLLRLKEELAVAAPISAAQGLFKSAEEGANQIEGALNKFFQ